MGKLIKIALVILLIIGLLFIGLITFAGWGVYKIGDSMMENVRESQVITQCNAALEELLCASQGPGTAENLRAYINHRFGERAADPDIREELDEHCIAGWPTETYTDAAKLSAYQQQTCSTAPTR